MMVQTSEIVLLPGLDGSGELYADLERRLAGNLHVTIVRYPRARSMKYKDYVNYVRSEIGKRSVVILGESFSGPIAIQLAAQFPEQVRGVVLTSTFLKNPWPKWALSIVSRTDLHKVPHFLIEIALLGLRRERVLSSRLAAVIAALPREIISARLEEVAGVDVSTEFARLQIPLLVLHGTADLAVPRWTQKPFFAAGEAVRFEQIKGPHMLLQCEPVRAASIILEFINSLGK
ncbi:MAG: alpha/beta fold hydrolase [Hyphomicrobium sp.]